MPPLVRAGVLNAVWVPGKCCGAAACKAVVATGGNALQTMGKEVTAASLAGLHGRGLSQAEKCIQDWQDLLAQIGSCSITFVAAAASQDPYAAFEASLRAYTPSTIAQYFRRIRAFLAFIGALGFGVGNLLLVHLVDLLHACENSKLEDRSSVRIAPRPMLKALSWLARIGQVESLASLLSNPLAKAFASPQQPQERKEALPLPWQF